MSKLKTNYVGYVRGKNTLKNRFILKDPNSRHGGGKRPSWKTQPSRPCLAYNHLEKDTIRHKHI